MFSGLISKTIPRCIPITGRFCVILFITALIGCGGGGSGGEVSGVQENPPATGSSKEITSFYFSQEDNPELISDAWGNIAGTNISVVLPLSVNRSSLVATFATTGDAVYIGPTLQISSATANDFNHPQIYTVVAENGSEQDYTVTVGEGLVASGAIVADHLAAASFSDIPEDAVTLAKSTLRIAYGHTSHGSQLVTGMNALAAANSLYAWNASGSNGALSMRDQPFAGASDLGNPDRVAWADATRTYLDANPAINVVVWSWCGQVSGATAADIDTYLGLMNELEQDYPGVDFVYMTGHLDGSGADGNLHLRNEQIRAFCRTNNRILFDFAAIESYDPDGATNYMMLNATDACAYSGGNWANEWIAANPGHELTALADSCGYCSHSETLNCVLKGRAAWWLWARLAGWDGTP